LIRSHRTSWLVFAGVLLLVACFGLSESFLAQWRDLNGTESLGKLGVNADLSADPSGSAQLTLQEADKLAGKWGRPAFYSARTVDAVSGGDKRTEADVFGVSALYDRFANFPLVRGSLLTGRSIEEHARVVLISSELADKLFRTRDVVGMPMQIMGVTFKIVGVYEASTSLLHKMTDNGKPDLLVPVTTLSELRPSIRVSAIELQAGPGAVITGGTEVRNALAAIGKSPSGYRIVNYAAERDWIAQMPKLLLAAVGLAGIGWSVRLMLGRIRKIGRRLRRGLAAEDWPDVLRRDWKTLAADLAALAALLASMLAVWLAIRHRYYIPARLFPEELIDWSFYRDLWLAEWRRQVATMGYVATPGELIHMRVELLVGRLTCTGLLAGLPLVWIGLRQWALEGVDLAAGIVRLAAYTCAAAVISAVAAQLAGTDYVIRPQDLFVIVCMPVLGALAQNAANRRRR